MKPTSKEVLQILEQMEQFSCLEEADCKQGICDTLNDVLDRKRELF